MTEEIFEQCKSEYVDTAGLYQSEDFEKVSYIYFLNNRVNSVSIFLKAQRLFIKEFGQPCEEYFKFIKKFGHNLRWSNNLENFEIQLKTIEQKETLYASRLKKEIKELKESREKQVKVKTEDTTRATFFKTLNSLGKIGYKFDEDKTTVERLALIIVQQKQEIDSIKNT